MEIVLEPGRYIVAVSGGVDSMALLHMLLMCLRRDSALSMVVAHFDHGIRANSSLDADLVHETAQSYGLPFVTEQGNLGPHASEATARHARYDFLERVRQVHGAEAIVTAHHQDDLMETVVLNLMRGTGRKGLSPLRSRPLIQRPLLSVSKSALIDYAHMHQLRWHEDATNTDDTYRRNYIRHHVLPRFSHQNKAELLHISATMAVVNHELDTLLNSILTVNIQGTSLDRALFIQLPYATSVELLASWLRLHGLRQFDRLTLERVTIAAKTYQVNKIIDLRAGSHITVGKTTLALHVTER